MDSGYLSETTLLLLGGCTIYDLSTHAAFYSYLYVLLLSTHCLIDANVKYCMGLSSCCSVTT